jgi:hypothetical protein
MRGDFIGIFLFDFHEEFEGLNEVRNRSFDGAAAIALKLVVLETI